MGKPRKNPDADLDALVQSKVSQQAHDMLVDKATGLGLGVSAYVRQVLYRHLGILKE
jgi:hypothetical protein